MKTQNGFTLIEMLIVLAVISILLILFIPNIGKESTNIRSTGCEALLQMAENQVVAYEIDNGSKPADIQTLVTEDYLKSTECDNGNRQIIVDDPETFTLKVEDVS